MGDQENMNKTTDTKENGFSQFQQFANISNQIDISSEIDNSKTPPERVFRMPQGKILPKLKFNAKN